METPAPDANGVLYRSAALAHGLSDRELRRACGGEELVRLAPGCFTATTQGEFADERHRQLALALAAKPDSAGGVLSHQSAAVVHGLGLIHMDYGRVHFSSGTSSGDIRRLRHTHAGPLADDEVVVIGGIAVTSLERTAVDVACASQFPGALTVVDSAVRAGADREVMREICDRRRRKGIAVARRAIAQGSAEAENPGESWCRAQMLLAGLPEPTLQREYWAEGDHYFVDFDFDGKVVHEFDGVTKYTKLLRPGEHPSQAVIREKVREDRLRGLGLTVDRSTWSDLRQHTMIPRLAARLRDRGVVT